MTGSFPNDLPGLRPPFIGALVEKVGDRTGEDTMGLAPGSRLEEDTGLFCQSPGVLDPAIPGDVAVKALGADLVASPPRVPGGTDTAGPMSPIHNCLGPHRQDLGVSYSRPGSWPP